MANLSTTSRRTQTWVTIAMAVCLIGPTMFGFAAKFIEFVHVFRGDASGIFAITPITNYLLASLGFLMLLGWAAFNGMFHDIESPKYRLLETERELDERQATP